MSEHAASANGGSTQCTAARVWLISGCSSGFGRELARAALARGERVVAGARRVEDLSELLALGGERVAGVTLDVTRAAHCTAAVHEGVTRFGRIDGVINNAGYGIVGALEDTPEADLRHNFETNFFGAVNLTRAVLPTLRGQRSGVIVNISAAAAISNYAGFGAYGASKAALEFASEALREELRGFGIRVMVVQPGPFRTDFISRSLKRVACSQPEYEASVGKFAAMLGKMSGRQTGDPAKAAGVILDAACSENPPLRLVLGKYAQDKVRRKTAATLAELETWGPAGAATDFSV